MFDILFLIWYMIAILPLFIFNDATARFSKFLKEKNIYQHWDFLHSLLLIFVILLIIFYSAGHRF